MPLTTSSTSSAKRGCRAFVPEKDRGYPAAAAKYRQREQDLAQDWRRLDDRIEAVTDEIDALSKNTNPVGT